MDDLEEKLGNILNDPDMMRQIMSMAQSMRDGQTDPPSSAPPLPELDTAAIGRIYELAQSGKIDRREHALLQALGAYLSKERIGKLEKAMRAAKLAKLASSALAQRSGVSSAGR